MFQNIEKALTIMLLAIGVKLDGEDEQGKKGKKDLFGCNHGLKPSAYKCIPKYSSGTTLER